MRQCFKTILAISVLVLSILNCNASETLMVDGSTGVKPLVQALAEKFKDTEHGFDIEFGDGLKPKARIQALLDGEMQIAMASHGIDVEQIKASGLFVHQIAKMAVVMGVHQSVQIRSLSHQEICDIYSEKTTNWQSLDGANQIIKSYLRPFNEVDTEIVSAYIGCFHEEAISPNITVMAKSGHMAKALAKTPGAIGMTTQVRVGQSKGQIKAISINDVAPSVSNLENGAYPFTRDMFLITDLKPSSKVTAFLAYIFSAEGRQVIIENNAVPIVLE